MSGTFFTLALVALGIYLLIILWTFPFSETNWQEPLWLIATGYRLNPKNRLGWLIYASLLLVCLLALLILFSKGRG